MVPHFAGCLIPEFEVGTVLDGLFELDVRTELELRWAIDANVFC